MKFLGIDTSGPRLTVVAVNGDHIIKSVTCTAAHTHSVRLMGEIDDVLSRAHMRADECDFLACVTGPGSFTGIRIGIATVKGLCFALEKPALAVTSLDCIAYAESGGKRLALVDAGHGNFYACGYGEGNSVQISPAFFTREEAEKHIAAGYIPVSAEALPIAGNTVDAAEGFIRAAIGKCCEAGNAGHLTAAYLRKSSAEENR